MPSLPTRAQALWILVPTKYKLSATLAGSAYHVSFAGGPGGVALVPRQPHRPAGSGTTQVRRNVPGQ
jgi:hypothetical protein